MFFNIKKFVLPLIIFIFLLKIGFLLSERKLVWTDEMWVQNKTINMCSYKDIFFKLNFPELNNSPTFFIIQKLFSDIFSYHYSFPEDNHGLTYVTVHEPRFQFIMRSPSNIYMSLALAIIFYFFSARFTLIAGFYALATALSVPMVWMYWVEAKPYSLWFLLTVLQVLISCDLIMDKHKKNERAEKWLLLITHLLLAFTVINSLIQITIVTFLISLYKKFSYRFMLLLGGLPIAIIFIYIFLSFNHTIGGPVNPLSSLLDVLMPEHVVFYVIYLILAGWALIVQKNKIFLNGYVLTLFLLFLTSAVFFSYYLYYKPMGNIPLHSRYLIYMVPMDIIMTVFVSQGIIKFFWNSKPVVLCICVVLGWSLALQSLLTYEYIFSQGLYLHVPG